jgi:hypothetical protein
MQQASHDKVSSTKVAVLWVALNILLALHGYIYVYQPASSEVKYSSRESLSFLKFGDEKGQNLLNRSPMEEAERHKRILEDDSLILPRLPDGIQLFNLQTNLWTGTWTSLSSAMEPPITGKVLDDTGYLEMRFYSHMNNSSPAVEITIVNQGRYLEFHDTLDQPEFQSATRRKL